MLDDIIGVVPCTIVHCVCRCVLSLDGTHCVVQRLLMRKGSFSYEIHFTHMCIYFFYAFERWVVLCDKVVGLFSCSHLLGLFFSFFFLKTWLYVTSAGTYGSVRSSSCDEMSMYVSVLPTCRHCRLPRDTLCDIVHCLHWLTSFQMLSLPTE